MARRHPKPSADPPAVTSSEEHVEEEVEESEDDEQEQHAQPDGSESSEEGVQEEEDEEEDQEDEDEEDDDDEEATKDNAPNSPAPKKPDAASKKENASLSLKRPAEAEGSKSASKKKLKAGGGVDEGGASEKKGGFVNRLWSEEDEIAILKGMVRFHDKKGVDPSSDSAAFHEFVKKDLSVDVSKSQLMDKVRRLKRKYRTNAGKAEKGEDPVFTRAHESKAFQLSKKVWGGLVLETRKAPPPPPPKKNNQANEQSNQANEQCKEQREGTFSELYPFLSMSLKKGGFGADLMSVEWSEAMGRCLMYMDKSKLEELEEEWKKQILAENDVVLKRTSLLQKQIRLLSDWRVERG